MIKCGNLFEKARAILEKQDKEVTPIAVIDKAIELRRRLDILEEIKERKYNHSYYLKRRIR